MRLLIRTAAFATAGGLGVFSKYFDFHNFLKPQKAFAEFDLSWNGSSPRENGSNCCNKYILISTAETVVCKGSGKLSIKPERKTAIANIGKYLKSKDIDKKIHSFVASSDCTSLFTVRELNSNFTDRIKCIPCTYLDVQHPIISPSEAKQLEEEQCELVDKSSIIGHAKAEHAFVDIFKKPEFNQNTNKYFLIVCDYKLISYFLCKLLQIPTSSYKNLTIGDCSITTLSTFKDGTVAVSSIGDKTFQ